MKRKNVIVLIILLSFVVLLMSSVQAKELTEVKAIDILKQIENGEDVYRTNVRITGNLNLDEIELETVTIARSVKEIEVYGLKPELKMVESKIIIRNSVIEDDIDFSNTQFRKKIDFSGTLFSGKSNFAYSDFRSDAYFISADFRGCPTIITAITAKKIHPPTTTNKTKDPKYDELLKKYK